MGNWETFLIIHSFCFFVIAGVNGGENEKRLLEYLLAPHRYNLLERPVANEKETLHVSFGLTLMQIIDVVRTDFIF